MDPSRDPESGRTNATTARRTFRRVNTLTKIVCYFLPLSFVYSSLTWSVYVVVCIIAYQHIGGLIGKQHRPCPRCASASALTPARSSALTPARPLRSRLLAPLA